MNSKYHVPAVERTFRIIESLATADGPQRLSELSATLKIPKTTVLMILTTLENLGYIQKRGDGKFQLSTKLFELGSKGNSLKELAHHDLELLAEEVKLTVHLSVLQEKENITIDKVNGPGFIQFSTYIGKRQAFHVTSSGKAMLAHLSQEQVASLLAHHEQTMFTSNTILDLSALHAELSHVREQGYAVDDQEEDVGVRCVGVPIFNATNQVIGAVSVTAVLSELPITSIPAVAIAVKKTAASISHKLGFQPTTSAKSDVVHTLLSLLD
ncbi:MAG TPA: IclR family transcriptional regulator [Ktedonobacteraceae bacterium]|jgi:DNA-binding IclR family transcriptional regulator